MHNIKGTYAQCSVHGIEVWKGLPKQVKVPFPRNRKDRVSGCPTCNKEKMHANNGASATQQTN